MTDTTATAADQTESKPANNANELVFDPDQKRFLSFESNLSHEEILNKSSKSRISEGIVHMLNLAAITVLVVPLAHSSLSFENIAGFALLLIYLVYLGHIWYLYATAHSMHRIHTVLGTPPDWINMSIAYGNESILGEPIASISEFSAIAGGVGKMLLARVGTITWGILITLVTVQIKENTLVVGDGVILEVIGAFGIDMIGTFYDDPHSLGMRCFHFGGIILGLCCLIGFWIQRVNEGEHIWVAALLTVTFLVFFALFWFYNKCYPIPQNSDLKFITKRSRILIGFETIGLGSLSFSLCFFFMMYPDN